ncbi:superoxide dismutase family protein [Actinoalloteichus caeruleus]|uniref:Superoxide dismutase [Cu-Zn] n=1 Tax=Actinoalloteichus caeruleus DSM 43889 TaxID=1120930 RepID=A0ABT1JHF4_ACTCY|nr:superoxide dismutase family protein [Actinoalloteichus caeruleus]MCP2331211.1 superoxide dismutase, Cu-Zn family [Actinoalloteichus caeruleus DSM 43889]
MSSAKHPPVLLGLLTAGVLATSGCGGSEEARNELRLPDSPTAAGSSPAEGDGVAASAVLVDASGNDVGTVRLREVTGGVEVVATVSDLDPGFHGFHVHQTGRCEPDSQSPSDPEKVGDFLTAGGHLGSGDDQHHPGHGGDLTSLFATEDGVAELTTVTDRFTIADLVDEDGAAFIVHAGPDNFGNIPERYAPDGPDSDTLSTGDAGDRVACGVVTN